MHEHEDLEGAARRELAEETGITADVYLEQMATVGTPGRDPRGHVITVVYVGLIPAERHQLSATGDAREARWFPFTATDPLPPLAFDHGVLLEAALAHLRRTLGESPSCFALLPPAFTLSELQKLCEAILGRELDRGNFRRKLLEERGVKGQSGFKFLAPVPGTRREGRHRPAQLYRFVPEAFAHHVAERRGLPF